MRTHIPHRFESLKPLYIPLVSSHIDHPILFYSILHIFLSLYSLSTITNLSIRVLVGRPRPSPRCLLVAWFSRTRRFQIQVIKWRHLWGPFESKSSLSTKAQDETPKHDVQSAFYGHSDQHIRNIRSSYSSSHQSIRNNWSIRQSTTTCYL